MTSGAMKPGPCWVSHGSKSISSAMGYGRSSVSDLPFLMPNLAFHEPIEDEA
jgi:hypothetical protein